MRKAIIKWLFGEEWEEYWDLHKKYIEELSSARGLLKENIKLRNEHIQELKNHMEEIDSHKKTIALAESLLEENKILRKLCILHGITIESEV